MATTPDALLWPENLVLETKAVVQARDGGVHWYDARITAKGGRGAGRGHLCHRELRPVPEEPRSNVQEAGQQPCACDPPGRARSGASARHLHHMFAH